jgi:hypothetical protein
MHATIPSIMKPSPDYGSSKSEIDGQGNCGGCVLKNRMFFVSDINMVCINKRAMDYREPAANPVSYALGSLLSLANILSHLSGRIEGRASIDFSVGATRTNWAKTFDW